MTLAACSGQTEDVDALEGAQERSNCGNGTRDPGEQCDDGNKSNLDGCSASCTFEQTHRLNSVEVMFGTDAFCTKNAIGGAIKGVAQGQIQDGLKKGVADGSISLFLAFQGLTDLTGKTPGNVTLGSFVGKPTNGVGLDKVFTADKGALTPDLLPAVNFNGAVGSGQALNAGPGNLAFALSFGDTPAQLSLSNTRAKAQLAGASAPGVANINLDPSLQSFTNTTGGQLCGNISAASLAAIPVPDQLASGSFKCTQGYTTENSMLDLIVGGCKVIFATALAATQPDEIDPTAGAVGAGGGYTLVAGGNKKISGCKDKSGANVDVNKCLKAAAYSAGFKFTSERAAVRGVTP